MILIPNKRNLSFSNGRFGFLTAHLARRITLIGYNNDLVILKVEGQGTPFPIYDGDLVEKGETIKAIGCPFGKYVTTDGVFHSTLNKGQWFQTTAKTVDGEVIVSKT